MHLAAAWLGVAPPPPASPRGNWRRQFLSLAACLIDKVRDASPDDVQFAADLVLNDELTKRDAIGWLRAGGNVTTQGGQIGGAA